VVIIEICNFLGVVLICYHMYIIVQSTIVWKPFWKKKKNVSIFILTEGDAGGLFLNIMKNYLFICLRI
jgi:hypothetical protein